MRLLAHQFWGPPQSSMRVGGAVRKRPSQEGGGTVGSSDTPERRKKKTGGPATIGGCFQETSKIKKRLEKTKQRIASPHILGRDAG